MQKIIEEICGEFTDSKILSVAALGDGHINDTFLAVCGDGKYVCQRMRRGIDIAGLEHNFLLYSPVFKKHEWLYPEWVRNREGQYFYCDGDNGVYRVYPYIEGDILNAPLSGESAYACGRGLAKLHGLLKLIPGKPRAVYPYLHDLKHYHEAYKSICAASASGAGRDSLLERTIEMRAGRIMQTEQSCRDVIHGDAKLSNLLFKGDEAAGCLDMDTVMKGSAVLELADCIRSCCISEGMIDRNGAERLTQGYLSVADGRQAEKIRQGLPLALERICFELGLRYYTDSLSPVPYFKEKYEGYRLDRARELLAVSWDDFC